MKKKVIIVIMMIIATLVIAVGFAQITNIKLNILGDATATPDQANFKVEFTGEPKTSDSEKVTAKIDETNKTKATLNVKGLTAKGESVTATYTIKNLSPDLSASLLAKAENDNTEYFKVEYNIEPPTTLTTQGETTITVKVTLIKTPIDTEPTGTTTVTITAKPIQP